MFYEQGLISKGCHRQPAVGCSVEEQKRETENIKKPEPECNAECYHPSGLNNMARRLAKEGNLRNTNLYMSLNVRINCITFSLTAGLRGGENLLGRLQVSEELT